MDLTNSSYCSVTENDIYDILGGSSNIVETDALSSYNVVARNYLPGQEGDVPKVTIAGAHTRRYDNDWAGVRDEYDVSDGLSVPSPKKPNYILGGYIAPFSRARGAFRQYVDGDKRERQRGRVTVVPDWTEQRGPFLC